jgi:hypothetical protein
VSLLMEALKKAEQAKQSGDASAESGQELRLEPIDEAAPATTDQATTDQAPPEQPAAEQAPPGKQLPELPAQLEVLDADFIAHAASAPPKRAAKPTAETPPPQPAPSQQPPPQAAPAQPPPAAGGGSVPGIPAWPPRPRLRPRRKACSATAGCS